MDGMLLNEFPAGYGRVLDVNMSVVMGVTVVIVVKVIVVVIVIVVYRWC